VEERFQTLEADYQNVTVKRLQEMEADKQQAEQEVAVLQEAVIQLKAQKSETDQRFVEMEKTLVELGKLRNEVGPVIAGAQPVASIDGLNAETALILESNHITTVRALAEADVTRLKELGIRHNTAVSLVRKANERLKPR